MFRTYQVLFNRVLMCLDALIVVASFGFSWYMKFDSGWLSHGKHETFLAYRLPVVFGVVVFLVTNWISGLYRPMRAQSVFAEVYNISKSLILGVFVFMATLYFLKMDDFSRDALAIFAASFMVLTLVERVSIRLVLRSARKRGMNQKYILLVGWNNAATRFVNGLDEQPWFGYRVVGYLADANEPDQRSRPNVPLMGTVSQMSEVLSRNLVDQVIIAVPREHSATIAHALSKCEDAGIQSLILPDYFDLLPARPRFETFGDIPLIDTRYVPLDDAMNAAIKRGFDIFFSALVMLVLSPLYLMIFVAIKLSSPGPAIFVQQRVGKNRRVFDMYKFRTMACDHNVEWDSGGTNRADWIDIDETASEGWTIPDDPRRTRLGALLRRTSLDELPQFWNVLVGDMSVIGPRPERPYFVEQFKDEIAKYMVKHRVRPGITGWAQVHGWRGDTSIEERIRCDIEYIETWSFWMDVRIIGRTITHGFFHRNAY